MKKLITGFVLFFMLQTSAQTIEKFSIDSGGASVTAGSIEVLYTIGEVNVQELNTGTISLSEGFINAQSKIYMELLALLQGPSLNATTTGLMNDNLRENNYIPTTSPYADGATVDATIFTKTGFDAIVDWVWVELRQANDNTKVVNAKSALIQRQGLIVGLDGISNLEMNASPTDYYVVIKHRNHLGVMSENPIALSENEELVDFISSSFSTFGSNARVQLPSGSMALWAGDVGNTEQIVFSGAGSSIAFLRDYVLGDSANIFNSVTFPSVGYLNIDADLNGIGKFSGSASDTSIIRDNVLVHPSNIFNSATYSINGTVPPEN